MTDILRMIAFSSLLVTASALPALAQTQTDQTQASQTQQSRQNAGGQRNSTSADRQNRRSSPDGPTVVLEFSTGNLQTQGDLGTALLELADEPSVSEIRAVGLSQDGAKVEGTLVFDDPAAYRAWRDNEMDGFFDPIGGVADENMTLRLFRSALVAKSSAGDGRLGNVSVTYDNTGNDSAGDADIDAVTVICPGDNADCKPSN